jgi:polyketide cyclase/dehydrase/lipid transport protein
VRASISTVIRSSPEQVFEILHDYGRRLEWDTLLTRAELLGGATAAGVGVRTLCEGRGVPMETEYVSFVPGKVAAVKLLARQFPFETFAASIRHERIGDDRSRVIYVYAFTTRRRWLAPVANALLWFETRKRLSALKRYVERR